MRITSDLFEKSFFSIGGGYDIQPIIRFSHICDVFINVNLFIEQQNAMDWYDRAFKYCNDIIVQEKYVVEQFDETEYFELHENYQSHLSNTYFFTQKDYSDYKNEFSNALGLKQYAIVYKLFRKSVGRTVTFYFCTAEGLASYILLSQNGKYAPTVLCTVQTGVLERPDGIINAIFQNKNMKHPKLWIRGFEPRYHRIFGKVHNNALDSIYFFDKKVMDINLKWTCGWSYPPFQQKIDRYCKGYVSEATINELASYAIKEEFTSPKTQFLFESLGENPELIRDNHYIVVSKKTKINLDNNYRNLLYWENFTRGYHWFQMNSVKEQVRKLAMVLDELKTDHSATIHLIPFCLEDEGESYFRALQELPYKTITYLPNLWDFIDLKNPTINS
jgi:hypothetical protein